MSGAAERGNAQAAHGASVGRSAEVLEHLLAGGRYHAWCTGPIPERRDEYVALRDGIQSLQQRPVARLLQAGRLRDMRRRLAAIPIVEKWRDDIVNTVTTEGKNALLTHAFKASALTQTLVLGIIESTGFSAYNATNTAANITAVGGGSPTNGWNEATSSMCAARGSPSMGTASAGALATSAAVAFSIIATATIKGAFMMMKSTAGTAPTTTVGNTNGALYSAGNFTGGDKSVANGDTLNVTYTASV